MKPIIFIEKSSFDRGSHIAHFCSETAIYLMQDQYISLSLYCEANILVLQQRQLWILSLGVFDQVMLCNQWLESWLNSVA